AAFDATQSPFYIVSLMAFSNSYDELTSPISHRRHGLSKRLTPQGREKTGLKLGFLPIPI
ncbi:hypothetical protein, partial [Escherichia coli]|uniref:hypothetical protein n=1 Tax=Escherichia coli TaxID=562 RepID=UPI0022814286